MERSRGKEQLGEGNSAVGDGENNMRWRKYGKSNGGRWTKKLEAQKGDAGREFSL
jgi:hypothetical protein